MLDGLRCASLYRSRPLSPHRQPDFLNTAVVARTDLGPEDLLGVAKALERRAGRRRSLRDGPRPLDVDLLLHGSEVRSGPELVLPHPRLAVRRFYLEPLAEIAAQVAVPPSGRSVADLLAALGDDQWAVDVGWTEAPPGR